MDISLTEFNDFSNWITDFYDNPVKDLTKDKTAWQDIANTATEGPGDQGRYVSHLTHPTLRPFRLLRSEHQNLLLRRGLPNPLRLPACVQYGFAHYWHHRLDDSHLRRVE